jgi:PKD repeat protein
MRYLLLSAITFLTILSLSAQTLIGTVTDPLGAPVANARITLFNADTTQFWETRTNTTGQYLMVNLPSGIPLSFGAAKTSFAYFQNNIPNIIGTVTHNAQLAPETEQGQWNVIMVSPEPLGGTDLGVLLPNGTIYYCHSTKDPFAFDPVTNDTVTAPGDTKVQGCVAPKLLWNGKVIMAGGTDQEIYGPGSNKVKQYNTSTKTWQPLPPMLDYRWYPSMTQLADGRLLITGGGGLNNPVRVNTTELYNPLTGVTELADTIAIRNEQSPILTLYNGKALMTFRPPQLFDPTTKQWNLASDFVQGNRMPNGDHVDHELVHLPEGDVIAIGFKPFPAGSGGNLVERYDPIANTWTLRADFAPLRSRAETVLMPDRRILTLGGFKEEPADPSPVNQWGYMDLADLYDPYADTWRRLKPMPRKREYHALATLVPDGRVIVVGGEGSPGNEPPQSIIDAYKPPYLFRGVRPQVVNLEKTDYYRGDTIRFVAGRTNAPTSVVLQSTTAVTHMMNCGENRFLDLNFFQQGQAIEAIVPNDSLRSMPGWYMLWAMVDDIPSVARMVRILPGPPVVVVTPPTAGFTVNQTDGCAPLTVQFTSTSSSNTTSFNWQFPGAIPSSSTTQNPTVVYPNSGNYSVTLTVSNSAGSNSVTQTNYITVNPLTAASFSSMVNGTTVSFINTSSNATSYAWDFGDGSTSTQTDPSHLYVNDGAYTVTLLANGLCDTDTTIQSVVVTTPPTAGFSSNLTAGCAPVNVQFSSTSSANATNFDWQFPGGSPSSSSIENPTVLYSTPGTYSVTLTVSNSAGSNTVTQSNYITVSPLPASGFSSSILGAIATFTNTSTNASSYLWDFGDGETSTQISPSHTYANNGTYTVTLVSTGPCGTASDTQTITIITVNIKEPGLVESFRVFPNPLASGGFLSVEMDLKKAGKVNFELTDATGKQVRAYSLFEKTIDRQVFTLKTTGIQAGVYLLTVRLDDAILGTEKVILR